MKNHCLESQLELSLVGVLEKPKKPRKKPIPRVPKIECIQVVDLVIMTPPSGGEPTLVTVLRVLSSKKEYARCPLLKKLYRREFPQSPLCFHRAINDIIALFKEKTGKSEWKITTSTGTRKDPAISGPLKETILQ